MLSPLQKRSILRANLYGISLIVSTTLFFSILRYIQERTGHTLPTTVATLNSFIVVYILYRMIYRMLQTGLFETKRLARLTAGVVVFQLAIQTILLFTPLNYHGDYGSLLSSTDILIIFAALYVGYSLIIGVIAYFSALKRAKKVLKSFKEISRPMLPRITGPLRVALLIYTGLVLLGGLIGVTFEVYELFSNHYYAQATDIPSWISLATILLQVIKAKPLGSTRFWYTFVPMLLLYDVVNIFVQSHGNDLLFNLGLSLPGYAAAIWYAYKFMPAAHHHRIKRIKQEELFV